MLFGEHKPGAVEGDGGADEEHWERAEQVAEEAAEYGCDGAAQADH